MFRNGVIWKVREKIQRVRERKKNQDRIMLWKPDQYSLRCQHPWSAVSNAAGNQVESREKEQTCIFGRQSVTRKGNSIARY